MSRGDSISISAQQRTSVHLSITAKPRTLRDLVSYADKMPPDQVFAMIFAITDSMKEDSEACRDSRARSRLRRLVILGALLNRAIFQLADIPVDPDFLL